MDEKNINEGVKKCECGMNLYHQNKTGLISIRNIIRQDIFQKIKAGYIEVTCGRCRKVHTVDETNWFKFDPVPDGIGILDGGEICHWDLKELKLN